MAVQGRIFLVVASRTTTQAMRPHTLCFPANVVPDGHLVQAIVTSTTHLAGSKLIHQEDLGSVKLGKPTPKAFLWGGGITETC